MQHLGQGSDFLQRLRGHGLEDVMDLEGHSYSLRVRPYVTVDKNIDGASIVLLESEAFPGGTKKGCAQLNTIAKRNPHFFLDDIQWMLSVRENGEK